MVKRTVHKSLVTMEDLAQGEGKVNQQRGGKQYNLGKVDLPYTVLTEAALKALDVTKVTKAKLNKVVYKYDIADNSGITPDVGLGSWVKSTDLADTSVEMHTGANLEDWAKGVDQSLVDGGYWVDVGEWSTNPTATKSNEYFSYAGTNQRFRPLSLPYTVNSAAHPNPNDLLPDPATGYAGELVDVSKFITENELHEYTDSYKEIPANGGDTALAIRNAIAAGEQSVLLDQGVHYFKTTVPNGDGSLVFAEIPDYFSIRTKTKNTELRPTVVAYAFFTPLDVAATDIKIEPLRAFGVAKGTVSPRLVNKFLPARAGDEGRIVRLLAEGVETVGFDSGIDSYSWSSNLTNTDSGYSDIGYNFRYGSVPPTSLRLIGAGSTSCQTTFNIDRMTYGTMLNCFSDDSDVGVVIGEAKNMDIINHGFEFTKQLFKLGTDDYRKISVGLNVKGAFVWQRVRKNEDDVEANYADWAAECYRLYRSTLDFSGVDNDWFTRNKRNFLYLKSCFKVTVDGIPRECVVVDYTGDSKYEDVTAGGNTFNLSSDFFVSRNGSDENMGSNAKPFLTFDKVDFVIGDDLITKRSVTLVDGIDTPLILKNIGWNRSAQESDGTPRLIINGGSHFISGMRLQSVFGNLSDVLVSSVNLNSDGFISDCTGVVISGLVLDSGKTLTISGGNVVIENSTINGTIYCQRGAQVRMDTITGNGSITSAGSIIYASGIGASITQTKQVGGQIFV